MYKQIRHIAVFLLFVLYQFNLLAVEGKPKMRRACLSRVDSTITLLWFQPTDNCSSFTWFSLYGREDALSVYKHLGRYTNGSLNTLQYKLPNLKDWEFYLVYSKACNGTDSIYSDTIIIDNTAPDNSLIDSVSVDFATQTTIIGWKKNISTDVKGYILYYVTGTNAIINNTSNTFANDVSAGRKPMNASFAYSIAAYDSCNNTSLISKPHNTIHLTSKYDQCKKKITLNWTPYSGWDTTVNSILTKPYTYNVYVGINGNPYQFLGNFSSSFSSITYDFANFGDQYCFYVRAIKTGKNISSSSNITCISTNSIIPAKRSYIAAVSVQNDIVEMTLITELGTAIQKLNIYKSEDNTPFTLWKTVNFTGGTMSLTDNQVKVHQRNYSYYFTTEGPCNLIFDTTAVCKTILLKLQMNAPGDQDLNWNTYFKFVKNTEKQELLLFNSPNGTKSSPWNILNTFTPVIVNTNDKSNFTANYQQLCYCIRAIENSPNQFFRRQDTSYSNIECATADPIVYFPNAIQINGFNTDFFPQGVFLDYNLSSFQIYNRWGQLIYETNDIRKGWNGKLKDGEFAEEDVYAYRSIIVGINGKKLKFDGTVTVLK